MLLFSVLFFATAAVLPLTGGRAVAPEHPLYGAYLLAVAFLYFGWCWTHGGQTLGLRAWGLRVTRSDGRPLDWRLSALRFAAALLSLLPAGAGFLWAAMDRERLTWHDKLSGTRVIGDW